MNSKLLIRSSMLIILLVALGFLLKFSELGGGIDKNWVDHYIGDNGFGGKFIFVLVAVFLVTIGFPRQIISFLAGYAFGLNYGIAVALAACAIGCAVTFFFARYAGREWVSSKFPNRLKKADQFFTANTFVTTLLIRFMPAGSNIMTNLLAGVSGARPVSFIGGSTIGYIPQTIIFALLGSGFNIDLEFRITLSIVLFIISILLGLVLYQKFKRFGFEQLTDNRS